jgi:glutamate dehydrogenase
VTPVELINALLRTPTDLLWFGGIGTFIKARTESHADVGDKANDLTRVDAGDVRALVIGEGANLGVTQAGRIEYARKGGRINTDAIDNSAGVDTSDHEVNIKILLTDAARSGALNAADRNALLAEMTDDVGAHVLAHNYTQTLALSLCEASATPDLDADERMIQRLEREGKLNRRVEGLPAMEAFSELRQKALGLTRPELSKLIAYAKLDLSAALVDSQTPDDPWFETTLVSYFPPPLKRFEDSMRRHRLRRDIIATTIADDIVNIAGPTFMERVRDAVRAEAPEAALAFVAARVIHDTDALATRVNALDNKIPASAQLALHRDIAAALRRATVALSRRFSSEPKLSVGALVARYVKPVAAQRAGLWPSLTATERAEADEQAVAFMAQGAPEDLSRDVAALVPLTAALDIADLASARKLAPETAANIYRAVGAAFSIDQLRAGGHAMQLTQHWERLALRRLLAEINEDQRTLAVAAASSKGNSANEIVQTWIGSLDGAAAPATEAINAMQEAGPWTFAKIVLAAAALRALAMRLA